MVEPITFDGYTFHPVRVEVRGHRRFEDIGAPEEEGLSIYVDWYITEYEYHSGQDQHDDGYTSWWWAPRVPRLPTRTIFHLRQIANRVTEVPEFEALNRAAEVIGRLAQLYDLIESDEEPSCADQAEELYTILAVLDMEVS